MLTDTHRQFANEIVKLLTESTSVDANPIHLLGGVVYEVIDILKKHEIISQHKSRLPYARGVNFHRYISLDKLINPDIEPIKITITEYKRHWSDWVFRIATLFGIMTTFYFSYMNNENGKKVHELTGQRNRQLLVLDSLTKEVLYRDSLLLTEISKSKIIVTDSLVN